MHLMPIERSLASLLEKQNALQTKCESLKMEMDELKPEKEKSAMNVFAELQSCRTTPKPKDECNNFRNRRELGLNVLWKCR